MEINQQKAATFYFTSLIIKKNIKETNVITETEFFLKKQSILPQRK